MSFGDAPDCHLTTSSCDAGNIIWYGDKADASFLLPHRVAPLTRDDTQRLIRIPGSNSWTVYETVRWR